MSESRVLEGSLPVATARTVMSRSVTIPHGMSLSITTTEPILKSLIAFAACATDESELSATGSLVITSRTVLPKSSTSTCRDSVTRKNAWPSCAYSSCRRRKLCCQMQSICQRWPVHLSGGAWPAMAEPSTVFLDGLRDLQQARDDRPARDAYKPAGCHIARKVVAEMNARD